MKRINYFGVHNHTEFSNLSAGLDCMNKLPSLVAKAKKLGLGGIAITDHDNLAGMIRVNKMQKELREKGDDFVLALGNEIYLVDKFDPESKEKQRYYHFILVAKDEIGFRAIRELSSRAWYRSAVQRGRRRIPTLKSDIEEVMMEARGHIVASSACIGGEAAQHLLAGDVDKAKNFLNWCHTQFGDDFYVELQPSDSKEQTTFNKLVTQTFPDEKFIIATDTHYLSKEDFPIFEAFMRSQQETREVQEYYNYARLMDSNEVIEVMKLSGLSEEKIIEYLENTKQIMKQIKFFDLSQKFHIPKVVVPEKEWNPKLVPAAGPQTSDYPVISKLLLSQDFQTKYLMTTCLEKLIERGIWNHQYLSYLEEELDVFQYQSEELNDNFFAYFNTMKYYLDMAWKIDCAVGPSRGSASGSMICYLMDIVTGDPVKNGYYLWRFANKVRASVLDIDVDFQSSRRPALLEEIRRERGELGLLQVATYRKLTLKAAIGNAGRGYKTKEYPQGLDSDVTAYLSSLIEVKRGFVATLEQTKNGDDIMGFNTNHTFLKECKQYPGLLEIIEKMEGVIIGCGIHAAAVVFFDEEDTLLNHCSLMRAPNGDLITCLDLHDVEESGW